MLMAHIVGGFLLIFVVVVRFGVVARGYGPPHRLLASIFGLGVFQFASGAALIFANTGVWARMCVSTLIVVAVCLVLEYALRRLMRARAKQAHMLH